jgi:hypothetical protein
MNRIDLVGQLSNLICLDHLQPICAVITHIGTCHNGLFCCVEITVIFWVL